MRLLRLPRIAVLALLLANTPSLAQTRPATATDDEVVHARHALWRSPGGRASRGELLHDVLGSV